MKKNFFVQISFVCLLVLTLITVAHAGVTVYGSQARGAQQTPARTLAQTPAQTLSQTPGQSPAALPAGVPSGHQGLAANGASSVYGTPSVHRAQSFNVAQATDERAQGGVSGQAISQDGFGEAIAGPSAEQSREPSANLSAKSSATQVATQAATQPSPQAAEQASAQAAAQGENPAGEQGTGHTTGPLGQQPFGAPHHDRNAVITITPNTALKSSSQHDQSGEEDTEDSVTQWSSKATKAIVRYEEPEQPKAPTGAPQLRPLQ